MTAPEYMTEFCRI